MRSFKMTNQILPSEVARELAKRSWETRKKKYDKEFYMKGAKKPTQTKIESKCGGSLIVRPVGNTGDAVRGFDGDILGIDEAPIQPKQMWAAARPVISTNNGRI